MKLLIYLVCTTALCYIAAIVFAAYYASRMVFPHVPSSYQELPDLQTLTSSEGDQIAMLYLQAEASSPILLYSHGNGEDLGDILPTLKEFQDRGISVLAYDYPGYGQSSGLPSEASVFAAADAVFNYAIDQLNYTAPEITLYGRSLGSGPATWLATQYPVRGLIFDGAFSSTFRVMTHIKILPFDIFDNLSRLNSTQCPVLLIHGKLDRVVPFRHAEVNRKRLQARAQHLWFPDAGHNDLILVGGQRYWETVLHFIQSPTKLNKQ